MMQQAYLSRKKTTVQNAAIKQQPAPLINVYIRLDHTLGSWCSQNTPVQLTVSNCHYLCKNHTHYGRYLTVTPIPQTRTH